MGYKVLLGITQKEPIIEIKKAIALNGYSFFIKMNLIQKMKNT